jgi:hypothetical protein
MMKLMTLTEVIDGMTNIENNMRSLETEMNMNTTTTENDVPEVEVNEARAGVEQEIEAHETYKLARVDAELTLLAAIDEYLEVHSKGELRFFVEENL